MKKTFSLLLAAMLTLLCFSACAEEAVKLNENSDSLNFYMNVTNGMTLEQYPVDPGVAGTMEVAGYPDLAIVFSLMPDDSYTEQDMGELTMADVENLTGRVTADLGESTSQLYDMPCGLKAMVIVDAAQTEYITMTLKDGYFFYMEGFHGDFTPLSKDEIDATKAAFDSLSYEAIEK